MTPTDYTQAIDHWKLKLVRARAIRMGFRGADLSDVLQEVVLEILGFRFEPARANGATEATALTALIDRRLNMARRREYRYQRHIERIQMWMNSVDTGELDREEQINRSMDVQCILARLEPEDQELCRMLSAGQSIEVIADQFGCGWHTVKRRVDRLRNIFVENGMDGYMN